MRRNITVSLDDELARKIRLKAAERDMSVSRYLAELAEQEISKDEVYRNAMEEFLSLPKIPLSSPYPTRDRSMI